MVVLEEGVGPFFLYYSGKRQDSNLSLGETEGKVFGLQLRPTQQSKKKQSSSSLSES